MGREAQKKREEEAGLPARTGEEPDQEADAQQPQIDPAVLAMQSMIAFEDRRYLVQTVSVGEKDPNGMRELTFPVSPTKQITMVLAAELCDHIVKQFSGSVKVADLADLAIEKERADQAAKEAAKS